MNAIRWPVVRTFWELKAALRNGFELAQRPESINFALRKDGQYATPDKLNQALAVKASQSGWVAFDSPLEDGGRLYKLTARAPGEGGQQPAP